MSNYDMTCHAMAVHNARWETNCDTLYLSFVGDPSVASKEEGRGGTFPKLCDTTFFGDKFNSNKGSCLPNSIFSCFGFILWWCILLASRAFISLLRCSVQRHWQHVLEMAREQPHIDAQSGRQVAMMGL